MTTSTDITLTLELPDDPTQAQATLAAAVTLVQSQTYVSAVRYDSALLDGAPATPAPPMDTVVPTDPSEIRQDTDPLPSDEDASA